MGDKERFVEDLLEASLQRHYRAEPRAGLEARILASVAARERAGRRRWLWTFAAATATVVVAVIALHDLRRRPTPPPAVSRAAAPIQHPPVTFAFSQPKPAAPPTTRERLRRVAAKPSRPAQFPTPRPLTEEEELLVAYVQRAGASGGVRDLAGQPLRDIYIAALENQLLPDTMELYGK